MKIEIDRRGTDRIHEDQRVFRRLLEAFSYPGKVVVLAEGKAAHAVVLSTLADTTTPLWIDESFVDIRDRAIAARWPMVDRKSCTFALCRGEMLDRIDIFPKGSPADPHLSATVIAEVTGLSGGAALNLSGPGIGPGGRTLAPLGLPATFLAQWTCNNAAYPLGVDLILTAGDWCACLPRSVRLEISDVRSR
ncbi:phosphonate C-P lyase system protein PhnH [Martelella sp. FLE1502]|uniref:phosphonate C-P lyase system protein PhnH n=1 Tax=unclassified Martelella TaxID=2629616 RepID=UPI0015DFE7C4|nr:MULTISPECIES: phosphonate C-P lyase system protein PhnH [unclassified Martelella]